MEKKLIYGIQQIGVGVDNADKAFEWYATKLGSDVCIFEDINTATYMAPYMGGQPHNKKAILAANLQGGSAYEIWQYTDRKPQKPEQAVILGDLGIIIVKIKTRNIEKSYERLKKNRVCIISEINTEPDGRRSFYIKDICDNILCIKEFDSWYSNKGFDLGGNFGCVIGVSDIDNSLKLYSDILGYNKVIYDKEGEFPDLEDLPNGLGKFRRILLSHPAERVGGLSKLLGESQIELIQSLDTEIKSIFKNRYWGDIGFIHLCFDINNMEAMVKECTDKGFPFKVLSNASFDMGDANGHWGYIEDPDGTLIEFVETKRIPIIKKFNLNINLEKREPTKPLPDWMIKAMAMKRVKFKTETV
jgi:catechol 2,3-dioxygenase-like lactoylglutathione lyase family enzyme